MMQDRPGAGEDLKLVKDLFENVFMYDVFVKIDPTAEQIKSIISKLKAARNKFYDRWEIDRKREDCVHVLIFVPFSLSNEVPDTLIKLLAEVAAKPPPQETSDTTLD